jgi:RNA polymerase sigma-70 factor (ECF subfamily)
MLPDGVPTDPRRKRVRPLSGIGTTLDRGASAAVSAEPDTVVPVDEPARRPENPAAAALLVRIREGDRRAVDELYEMFGRQAFALARRILLDDGLAEDVVQEVFLSVWRSPGAFDERRAAVSSWLLAMVHHKAVDAVRREEGHRRRGRRAEDEMALSAPTATRDAEEQAVDRVVSQQVRTALGELPAAQREALGLAYYGGYTQREVAALTGVPLGTVKTRMLAGMRKLRADLGNSAGPAGDGRSNPAPSDGGLR